ncbi:MAG TPA: hypothetical protein VK977_07955, partial [Actinomycetota bacterium]|nr:hypothetical protein [Actinomycetota bacterium]
MAIYVTGISTSKVHPEFPPLRGTLTLFVQTKSSQEATRNAPLVTTRHPAVVYPAMRPGFEIGFGGGHRSRRR